MAYSPEQISQATGAPVANCSQSWPGLLAALDSYNINTHPVRVGVVGTVARETGIFLPIPEEGDYAYFTRMYEWRADLGNIYQGDGARFCGRGFLQITGRANYFSYGKKLGIDLVGNPELALDPWVGGRILCLYFIDRGIPGMCESGNWGGVQTAVNGGWVNWNVFNNVVQRLLGTPESDWTPTPHKSVTRLVPKASLKAKPDHGPVGVVADLAAGCTIEFTPDPISKQVVSPDGLWAHVRVTHGTTQKLKNAVGLQGWLVRSSLQTTSS